LRTKTKVLKIARIAHDKKGEDIIALDVRKVCSFTDYFVIVTGQTSTHLRAICGEIGKQFKDSGVTLYGVDGESSASWRVMDYGDVVFHCFTEDCRKYYNLENLWGDAKSVEWKKL
jgi:ribosome-associated protein